MRNHRLFGVVIAVLSARVFCTNGRVLLIMLIISNAGPRLGRGLASRLPADQIRPCPGGPSAC